MYKLNVPTNRWWPTAQQTFHCFEECHMVVFFAVEVHTYILLPSHQESSFMVLLPQILLDLRRGNLQKFTRREHKSL